MVLNLLSRSFGWSLHNVTTLSEFFWRLIFLIPEHYSERSYKMYDLLSVESHEVQFSPISFLFFEKILRGKVDERQIEMKQIKVFYFGK